MSCIMQLNEYYYAQTRKPPQQKHIYIYIYIYGYLTNPIVRQVSWYSNESWHFKLSSWKPMLLARQHNEVGIGQLRLTQTGRDRQRTYQQQSSSCIQNDAFRASAGSFPQIQCGLPFNFCALWHWAEWKHPACSRRLFRSCGRNSSRHQDI